MTSDLEVPSIITLTLDYTGIGPTVNIGSKSDFSYEKAIIGSIFESIQCRRTTRFVIDSQANYKFPTEIEIESLEERYFYWYPRERISDLCIWLKDTPKKEFEKIREKERPLNEALEILKTKGYHIFSADITLPELRNKGFEVVKVLVPELHPLFLDEGCKALYSIHLGEIKEDGSLKPHPFG